MPREAVAGAELNGGVRSREELAAPGNDGKSIEILLRELVVVRPDPAEPLRLDLQRGGIRYLVRGDDVEPDGAYRRLEVDLEPCLDACAFGRRQDAGRLGARTVEYDGCRLLQPPAGEHPDGDGLTLHRARGGDVVDLRLARRDPDHVWEA